MMNRWMKWRLVFGGAVVALLMIFPLAAAMADPPQPGDPGYPLGCYDHNCVFVGSGSCTNGEICQYYYDDPPPIEIDYGNGSGVTCTLHEAEILIYYYPAYYECSDGSWYWA